MTTFTNSCAFWAAVIGSGALVSVMADSTFLTEGQAAKLAAIALFGRTTSTAGTGYIRDEHRDYIIEMFQQLIVMGKGT